MVNRRGTSKLGCLAMLSFVAAIGYFGVTLGKQYWNYLEFKDAMEQEARFASHRTDDNIRDHLRAKVDSLGLPESAKNVRIRRTPSIIFIETHYYLTVEFPGFVKEFLLSPHAMGPL